MKPKLTRSAGSTRSSIDVCEPSFGVKNGKACEEGVAGVMRAVKPMEPRSTRWEIIFSIPTLQNLVSRSEERRRGGTHKAPLRTKRMLVVSTR